MKLSTTKYILLFLCIMMYQGCTNNFDEINTNPNENEPNVVPPELQLTFLLNRASSERFDQWRGNLIYCSNWAQQLSGDWDVDRYNTTNEEWLGAWWNTSYLNIGKDIEFLINNTPETNNIKHMASIFKVFFFQRLTDMYGDIPYIEALEGVENRRPIFDRQEDIYNTFIQDLTTAIAALDENNESPGAADLLYSGNVDNWRKFGNSILLRIAMRISNVNPDLASEVGSQAIQDGIIDNFESNAFVSYSGSSPDGSNANGVSEVFQDFGVTGHLFRFSDEFVNFIINNNDPRESILIETYKNDGTIDNNVGQGFHLGRPNGIPTGNDDFLFAQPNRETIVDYAAPAIYFGHAEAEFLRAEAILKGWVAGDAEEAYTSGIRAAMRQLELYPNVEPISEADVEDYLSERDIEFDSSDAIEQINTQKWVALLFDGFEAYANYRRSGYPDISPGITDGESDGEIPRRLRYPINERINNTENYDEAVSRLDQGDAIISRMWWDVN